MTKKTFGAFGVAIALALGFVAGRIELQGAAAADTGKLTALDYEEITQLINRYAYGIERAAATATTTRTCSRRTACSSTRTPTRASPQAAACSQRAAMRSRSSSAAARRGCKTKLPWTGWSHLMLNHEITATPDGAKGRIYLVQLGCAVRAVSTATAATRTSTCAPRGLAHPARTHVRERAWYAPDWQTADLN